MASNKRPEKHVKFFIYFVIVVLLNVAGATLFFRVDLTKNNIFSISEASKEVVSTLSEPMTINVFFTKDLPAPHNNTNRYLQDILKEYEISSNNYFNYKFYNISSSSDEDSESKNNKELAQSYGINPVQIRLIEKDEIKFKNAFMGIVLIHGDLIEKIPAVTSVDGLEYKLTMAMKKLNNKISALLALKDKIKIELYLSSSLKQVAPFMRLNDLNALPDKIQDAVSKINLKNYGRLEYHFFDPTIDNSLKEIAQLYNIQSLQWNDMDNGIKAGEGGIGLVMKYQDKTIEIPVLNVIRIPIIGTQYELIDMEQLDEIINGGIDSLIDINEKIGYLADHGTISRSGTPGMMGQGGSELGNFNRLVSQNYTIKDINLKNNGIATDVGSIIIANPTEAFSDFELYQIDQALMSGKSLALFIDSFKEIQQQQQFGMGQGSSFQPINTGLEKLLKHYGVTIEKSYVLDENCYKRPLPQQYGGGERKLYFVPQIESKNINNDLEFMNNINGLLTVKVSPISFNEQALGDSGIKVHKLFSSSEKSWEMKHNINLSPFAMRPPADDAKKKSYALSCLLEGSFSSYFTGKPVPEKEVEAKDEISGEDKKDLSAISSKGGFIAKGKPAKILIVTSSEMLKDNLLDEQGTSPNAAFVLNTIDTLNGRDSIAVMRSKKQSYNPLDKISPTAKMAVKSFNIAGLPILVVFFGLLVWLKRRSRKNHIQMMFQK